MAVLNPGITGPQVYDFAGKTFWACIPAGWSAADVHSMLLVGFCGDGETTGAQGAVTVPGRLYTTYGWNGQCVLNDGTVKRIASIVMPNFTNNYTGYGAAIDNAISILGMPTTPTDWARYAITGLSGGVARGMRYLTNYNGTQGANRFLFRKWAFQSTISLSSVSITSAMINAASSTDRGSTWAWLMSSDFDTNPNTNPLFTDNFYRDLRSDRKRRSHDNYRGHGNTTWDEFLNIRGVDTAAGGNNISDDGGRIRFLCDPWDGDPPPNEFHGWANISFV